MIVDILSQRLHSLGFDLFAGGIVGLRQMTRQRRAGANVRLGQARQMWCVLIKPGPMSASVQMAASPRHDAMCQKQTHAPQHTARLFDHLISGGE